MPLTLCLPQPRLHSSLPPVALWLWAVIAMLVVMVVLGGLTRLTGSGLSMVEWNPHHLLPPLTRDQWDAAFSAYRQSPQFRLVNGDMDLAGFQSIFWLEYVHRLWGRLIGLAFALPLAVFVAKGQVRGPLAWRLGLILLLGGLQGGVGWLMVQSGLLDRPDVSHFRLAAHLVLALVLLAALIWTALDVGGVGRPASRHGRIGRRMAVAFLGLAVLTVTWGAFVAGLHAGQIHNSFPLMGRDIFPADGLRLTPRWLNAFENPSGVQYVHRILGMTLVASLGLGWLWSVHADLPVSARRPFALAALWAWGQGGLGAATVLLSAPVGLAALHQAGAVFLFGLLVWLVHTVKAGGP